MRQLTPITLGLLLIALFLSPRLGPAADSPQWSGPHRNAMFEETGLLKQWPEGGPRMIWSIEGVGDGFSSPSIANGVIYVTGKFGKEEALSAYDLDGQFKWKTVYGKAWTKSKSDARTTPTVVDGSVYVISGSGEVACIDAMTGDLRWSVDALTLFEGKQGGWGTAESPLVVDDKVIYTPGGKKTTVVALDRHTGETVWMSESLGDKSAYVSPIAIEWGGRTQIIAVTGDYILGVDAADGKMLWNVKYRDIPPGKGGDINACTPLYEDGHIYVTSGYNHAGVMIGLSEDGLKAEVLWVDETLDTHHGGVVKVGNTIYGANWINNGKGNWVSVNWETGKPGYEQEWHNKGSIIAADGMLYCYEERQGNLGLVKANPEAFEMVSSFRIPLGSGPHWGHPVISDRRLYIRHGDVLMVYDIAE